MTAAALQALSRWAIEELGLGRVELVTDPDNIASQRVAEKAGFTREGVLRSILVKGTAAAGLWRNVAQPCFAEVSLRCAQLLAPARIEIAQPLDTLADRRVRHEHRGETLLGERVQCRAARSPASPELENEPAASSRTSPSASPCGDSQSAAAAPIGGELSPGREQQMGESGRQRREEEEQRALEPAADSGGLDQGARKHETSSERGRRGSDVREFVGNDRLDLRRPGSREEPVLTASDEPCPWPAENARGGPSGIRYSRGFGADLAAKALDRGVQQRSFAQQQLARADHAGRHPARTSSAKPPPTGRRRTRATNR